MKAELRHLIAGVILAGLLAGCGRTYYTPDVVGIVATREQLPDQSVQITLRDGRSQVVDVHVQGIIHGGGIPDEGELFLSGSAPKPWVARLSGADPCFIVPGGGSEEGDFIATDAGLRLPKADTFDRGHYLATEHRFESGGFCVNSSGEITRIR